MANIIPLALPDVPAASQTFFTAFQDDPALLWLFGSREKYIEKGLAAFTSWVKWCVYYGAGFATDKFEAVTLWKKPNKHRFTLWGLWRSGMLTAPYARDHAIRDRIIQFDRLIEQTYIKQIGSDNFWHCWLLATAPKFHHQGFGKGLMRQVDKLVVISHLPFCLETANTKNIPLYQKLGYEVFAQVAVPDSEIDLHFMIHQAEG